MRSLEVQIQVTPFKIAAWLDRDVHEVYWNMVPLQYLWTTPEQAPFQETTVELQTFWFTVIEMEALYNLDSRFSINDSLLSSWFHHWNGCNGRWLRKFQTTKGYPWVIHRLPMGPKQIAPSPQQKKRTTGDTLTAPPGRWRKTLPREMAASNCQQERRWHQTSTSCW